MTETISHVYGMSKDCKIKVPEFVSTAVAIVFLEVRVVLGVTGWERLGESVTETVVWMCVAFSLLVCGLRSTVAGFFPIVASSRGSPSSSNRCRLAKEKTLPLHRSPFLPLTNNCSSRGASPSFEYATKIGRCQENFGSHRVCQLGSPERFTNRQYGCKTGVGVERGLHGNKAVGD
jgi:hypothetical protein